MIQKYHLEARIGRKKLMLEPQKQTKQLAEWKQTKIKNLLLTLNLKFQWSIDIKHP